MKFIACLATAASLLFSSVPVSALTRSELVVLSDRLETALNGTNQIILGDLLAESEHSNLEQRVELFRKEFPGVQWKVEPAPPLPDGRPTLSITVVGSANAVGVVYQLEARQRIAVSFRDGRLLEHEILEEQSLMRSGETILPITLKIPNEVIVGSRFDVDLIVEKPLGQAIMAGGLLLLTKEQVEEGVRPNLPLEPLGGGGLFKSVQAPTLPCAQTWAAMLVHPESVMLVTKRIRFIKDEKE